MKSITSIKRAFAAVLAVIMILLVGCGGNDGPEPTDPANLGKKHNLSFVIIDDGNWDKEVTLGDYTYTIHVNLLEDGKLEVVGTCTGEALAQGGANQGGAGSDGAEAESTPATEGSDSGEGETTDGAESTPATEAPAPTESTPATEGSDSGEGESTPATTAPAATEGGNDSENGEQGNQGGQEGGESTPATTKPPMSDEDKKAQSFTQSGTWVYEKGLGYTLTINGVTTKTNYEKESGRTYFFFEIKNGEASTGLVQFAAKDTGFRADMGEDYTRWEDRDAEVTFFKANNTTGSNNSSTRLWVLPNGQAASLVYSGSSYTYKMGTWTKADNQNITVTIDGSDYLLAYCDTVGKEGYRVTYNSQLMYSRDDVEYVATDFDGAIVKSLKCAEGDYTLDLTSKGVAMLMEVAANSSKTTGTYVEEGGVLSVTMAGSTFVSEGNTITISISITTGDQSSGTTETIERTFTLE